MNRYEKYGAPGLLVLLVAASSSAFAQAGEDTFVCQSDKPGSPLATFHLADGELTLEVPNGGGRTSDFGAVEATETSYVARKRQPVTTDGRGLAISELTLNRGNGRYRYEMDATSPGRGPLHIVSGGQCRDFDPPGALAAAAPQKDADTTAGSQAHRDGLDDAGDSTADDVQRDDDADLLAQDGDESRAEAERRSEQAQRDRDAAQVERRRQQEQARVASEKRETERRQREEQARVDREKADAERRQREAEEARLAREQAAVEAKARAEQEARLAEQNLRSSFHGRATTCVGGGKDVLYLQTSSPSRAGCNVYFEARCPGTPLGSGVGFSQYNYIGGSCMGIGDAIRIGPMDCAAEQVQISMTSASCG
jgi:hypothetical protein